MKEGQMEGRLMKEQVKEEMEREKCRDLEKRKKAARTREEFRLANEELTRLR
jgi:colicin import membrane protein